MTVFTRIFYLVCCIVLACGVFCAIGQFVNAQAQPAETAPQSEGQAGTAQAPASGTEEQTADGQYLPFNLKESDLDLALPKRDVIIYSGAGRRDPFISLVEGLEQAVSKVNIQYMNIADLTLKGILQIPNGYLAIFEAVNGKSYLLKEGDQVYDGKLVRIEQNKVVFEKPEYDLLGTVKTKKQIDIPLHM